MWRETVTVLNVGGGDGKRSYGKPVRETNGKGDVELSEKDNEEGLWC